VEMKNFSLSELASFDGENREEIYISFCGSVFDVSSRRDLYGRSPPGPYHIFAGRECSRALATMSLDPVDVGRSDLDNLETITAKASKSMNPEEVQAAVAKALQDWQSKLSETYIKVGVLSNDSKATDVGIKLPILSGLRGAEGSSMQQKLVEARRRGPLSLVTRKPRMYTQSGFLSAEECQGLISMILRQQEGSQFEKKVRAPLDVTDKFWSTKDRMFLQDIENRLADLIGSPAHADETCLVGTLTPPGGDSIADHLGLHVDTNAAHWRFCTAIIYLSSVSDGGHTVFPAAVEDGLPSEESEIAISAARTLLDLGIDHTDKARPSSASSCAAQELLAAASAGTGLAVTPETGTACIFWTRQDDGEIDPHSWHGGAPVLDDHSWKWTLQKFKEVPVWARGKHDVLAEFVRQTRLHVMSHV